MALNVVFKVTKDCNLVCRYPCYYYHLVDKKPEIMELKILRRFFEEVSQLEGIGKFDAIWHGGEPLMAGLSWFEEALDIQRTAFFGSNIIIENAVQTNGVLLDYGWAKFLSEKNFHTGVSIDGPWHDSLRKTRSGDGSLVPALKAARLLNQHGNHMGALAVITKHSLGRARELVDFMLMHNITSFDVLPNTETASNGKPLRYTISGDEYAEFVIEVYEYWLELDREDVKIRTLEQMLSGIMGYNPDLCMFCRDCEGVLCLDVNGDVYPCDDFVGDTSYIVGNILTDSLQDILCGERYMRHIARTRTLHILCTKCEFVSICGGNCAKLRLLPGYNHPCFGRHRIFAYMKQRLQEDGYI